MPEPDPPQGSWARCPPPLGPRWAGNHWDVTSRPAAGAAVWEHREGRETGWVGQGLVSRGCRWGTRPKPAGCGGGKGQSQASKCPGSLSTEEGTGQGSPWATWKPPAWKQTRLLLPLLQSRAHGWAGECVHLYPCVSVHVCTSVLVCASVHVRAVAVGGDAPDTSELLGGQGRPCWGAPGRGAMPVPMGLRPRLGTEDLGLAE